MIEWRGGGTFNQHIVNCKYWQRSEKASVKSFGLKLCKETLSNPTSRRNARNIPVKQLLVKIRTPVLRHKSSFILYERAAAERRHDAFDDFYPHIDTNYDSVMLSRYCIIQTFFYRTINNIDRIRTNFIIAFMSLCFFCLIPVSVS